MFIWHIAGDVSVGLPGGVGDHERLLPAELVRAHHPGVLPVLDAGLDRQFAGHRRTQLDGAIRIPALGNLPQPVAGAGHEQVPAGDRAWGGPVLGAGGDSRRGESWGSVSVLMGISVLYVLYVLYA